MDFEKLDTRLPRSETETKNGMKNIELLFKFNHTLPFSEEYNSLMNELFRGKIGKGSVVTSPLQGVCFERITIGNNVYINSNLLVMARGGITIEDNVQIAANVQLITNNHDEYEREILLMKPIVIKKGAWIGAGATILPGVAVGKHAIVGAATVVTKDVPDYAVVVGSPARILKYLDKERFGE